MKLNLNFDLYKGTTRLKQWWKEVKAHFTEVQEAHNALEDAVAAESGKLSTEITQRTNADIALSDRINAEENTRSSADASLGQRITTEAKNREKADNNLQVRIDEISQSSGTSTLFGDELMTHTVKFVAPENKPTLYWDGDQEYYGDSICVDIELTNSFYIDGKQISGAFEELCISVPCDEGIYIVVQYNFADNTCDIKTSTNAVASTISGNVWTFTLYHYYDIRLDFKVDSSSPTGSRYVFEDCNTDYIEPNEDTTGNTYTIANTYERLRTLDNLNTENKNSFLDAVNENADKINYIISLRPSDREIFVMCDGDHDELKIQAALDAVATGGVVYPVTSNGDVAVLTNANTNKGYSPITAYDVVLKVGQYKTLDFRFCDGVMFDNTNPGDNQAVFNLSQYAEIKNLWAFSESSDTCTTVSINPTVLYTANYCIVDNCNFDSIQGMNTTTTSQFLFRVGQYCKFRNNTLNGISLNDIRFAQKGFEFGVGTVVENNLFQNITASNKTNANIFYFSRCNVEKNSFTTFDLNGNNFKITSGRVNDNYFYKTNNTMFNFAGIIKGNLFRTITANEYDITFLVTNNTEVVDNIFDTITTNDSYNLVDVEGNAIFSNQMYDITPSSNPNIPIVYLYDGAIFRDSRVKLKSGTDTAMVVMAEDGSTAVIKDNITNAASIGTYSSTCIVEGNITGFGA